MILHTLWISRKSDPEYMPECLVAWTEYDVEGNYEGFKADCDKAIASIGSDLGQYRHIDLEVPDDQVLAAFRPTRIKTV